MPIIRWMDANRRQTSVLLEAADLGYVPHCSPNQAVPLLNGIAFLRAFGRREGLDIGCRVVSATSVTELAMLGLVALETATPRAAIHRISAALPHHCTHEHIIVTDVQGGALVREAWALPLDDEALHLIQQYVAALIRALCGMTDARGPLLASVEIVPHPEAGLDHLRPWFGAALAPAASRSLSLLIDSSIADRPFRGIERRRNGEASGEDWPVLRGNGSLAASAREVVAAMLWDGNPTVDRLAAAAGCSARTLQRRLADERTSFSLILETARRDVALGKLSDPTCSLGELAMMLGYARQSVLTRSVRRWTGRAPSLIRGTRDRQ
jgi:AraC-like DNA-binding protein